MTHHSLPMLGRSPDRVYRNTEASNAWKHDPPKPECCLHNPHPGNIEMQWSDRKPNVQTQFLPVPEIANKTTTWLQLLLMLFLLNSVTLLSIAKLQYINRSKLHSSEPLNLLYSISRLSAHHQLLIACYRQGLLMGVWFSFSRCSAVMLMLASNAVDITCYRTELLPMKHQQQNYPKKLCYYTVQVMWLFKWKQHGKKVARCNGFAKLLHNLVMVTIRGISD
jgi:hypothetical protein